MLIGSLCSGYGGLDAAVQAVIPSDLAWVADPDLGAAKILTHHHPDVPNLGDITTVDWATVPEVDILTAGFPCQDISNAGKRAGIEGERSGIWAHVVAAVRVVRPRLVFLENVSALTSRGLDRVAADLAEVGFVGSWRCVRASDVGAPHRRERIFILAWPEGERPYFPRRSGVGGAGAVVPDGVTLFPTPRTSGTNGPGLHGQGGMDLRTAVSLLPTPAAWDWKSGQSNILDRNARPLNEVIENLLPTPTATPYGNNQSPSAGAKVRPSLDSLAASGKLDLLTTPRASDGKNGGPNQRGSKGDLMLSAAVQPGRWGDYAAAVARWERATGREAPAPTVPSGKDGRPRLNPVFTEWAMGLPAGHVTAPEVGLTRTQQLHALGNGVVPQQGAMALRLLLERAFASVAA